MTDRKALVARSLAEAQILKDLKAAQARTRAELAELFADAGEREVGLLLDHRIGTVELRAGIESWAVVDPDAFGDWVLQNFPDEAARVSSVEVRSSFRDAVLAKCKSDGAFYVNEESGEVFIPPGVARRKGAPSLVERPDKHAGFVVREWLGEAAERLGIEA